MDRGLWIAWMIVLVVVVAFIPIYGPAAAFPSLSLAIVLLALLWTASNLRMRPALPAGAALALLVAVPAYWTRLNSRTLPAFTVFFLLWLVGGAGSIILGWILVRHLQDMTARRRNI